MRAEHQPVLLEETLAVLAPQANRHILDATFGRGGHSRALLAAGARVTALDRDPEAIAFGQALVRETRSNRFFIKQMNFADIRQLAAAGESYDGILFDFGVSSPQLDSPERGFSFRENGPLDMRMGAGAEGDTPGTAADLVNGAEESELVRIFFAYGEERQARRIAAAIVRERARGPITRTRQLAEIIEKTVGMRGHRKIHPATPVFQALRIAVNDELQAIEDALEAVPDVLKPGGRLAAISFHALEDRRVKRFIEVCSREEIREEGMAFGHANPNYCFKKLGRFKPSAEEIQNNPRARSARLRAAEKVGSEPVPNN